MLSNKDYQLYLISFIKVSIILWTRSIPWNMLLIWFRLLNPCRYEVDSDYVFYSYQWNCFYHKNNPEANFNQTNSITTTRQVTYYHVYIGLWVIQSVSILIASFENTPPSWLAQARRDKVGKTIMFALILKAHTGKELRCGHACSAKSFLPIDSTLDWFQGEGTASLPVWPLPGLPLLDKVCS